MPIVELTIFEGRSDEAKLRAMKVITNAVVESLAAPISDVRVIIREIPRTHMTVAGELKPPRNELPREARETE